MVSLLVVIAVLWVVLWLRRRSVEPPGAPPLAILNNSRFETATLFRTDPQRFLEEARKKVSGLRQGVSRYFNTTIVVWQRLHCGSFLLQRDPHHR